MKHYSEVELLESYYLGGASREVASHLAGCPECNARFARLGEKLACSVQAHQQRIESRPDSFWVRQRMAITRSLRVRTQHAPYWRYAAAAVLTLLLGAAVMTNLRRDATSPPVAPAQIAGDAVAPDELATNPWEADALQPYAEMVEWEAWLNDDKEGS